MIKTVLKNLKPKRVIVRLQNSKKVRVATESDLEQLANVMMTQTAAAGEWIAMSSDKNSKYGTVLAVME